MHYATGYAFNLKEIFENFSMKKLKMKNKNLKGEIRRTLIYQVFMYSVTLILTDVFKNNNTFMLPTRNRTARIEVRGVFGEKFKQCKRNGKFLDIDPYKTNFAGYIPMLVYSTGIIERTKEIHVNRDLLKIITDNANNGVNYF